jgi:hypothetical protein
MAAEPASRFKSAGETAPDGRRGVVVEMATLVNQTDQWSIRPINWFCHRDKSGVEIFSAKSQNNAGGANRKTAAMGSLQVRTGGLELR